MGTTDVLKDIEEMNKIFENAPVTEEKKEEVKPPEEKKEEAKEEPKPEDKKVEEPPKEEEKKEAKAPEEKLPVETPKEPQPDERDTTITELRAKLAALEAEKLTPEKKPEPPKPETKLEEPKIEDQDFLGELDLDEVTRDPKEFNKLLNNLYKKARTDGEQAIITKLSSVISSQIETTKIVEKAGEDFYKANEDLKGFPKVVKVVFDEIAQKDPNRTLDEVMKDVALETRKRLGLPEPKAKVKEEPKKEEVKKDPPPKLPSKGSSAGRISESVDTSDSLTKELDEMAKAVR